VFDISPDTGSIVGSALNAYGQVAGVVHMSDANVDRSTVFLWTPPHTYGSDGVITYLTTLRSSTHTALYGRSTTTAKSSSSRMGRACYGLQTRQIVRRASLTTSNQMA
jgi:hypothetical protein